MCSVRDFLLIGLGVQYSRDERHDALSSSLRSHGLQDQQLLQRKQPAPKTQEQAINHPAWTTGQDGRLRGSGKGGRTQEGVAYMSLLMHACTQKL